MPKNRVRYIFTYGTLMSCCSGRQGASERARMQAGARMIGPAAVRGRVFDAGSCPAAILALDHTRDRVRGEIWELPEDSAALLGVLDAYEGCGPDSPRPYPYVRRRIRVRTADGRRVTAWMYLWTRPTRSLSFVATGRWREPAGTMQPLAACPVEHQAVVKRGRVPA
jgi:gamma-glutamylcyclotransferase (GGCT)/AIG2-like uncharacterized protein YtfP